MQICNRPTNNINYTSRCPKLKDAEWVCHTVSQGLQHTSTSKFKPMFQKQLTKYMNGYFELVPEDPLSLTEIYVLLSKMHLSEQERKSMGAGKKFLRKVLSPLIPKRTEKDTKRLEVIRDKIENFGRNRQQIYETFGMGNEAYSALAMLSNAKQGNCYEDAIISELVMKMNGVKNARTMLFKNSNDYSEHAVCVFNRDGSPVDEIINNQTIIIDPWAGKADFANNMIKRYQNQMTDLISLPEKKDIGYKIMELAKIPEDDMEALKQKFPFFVHKSKTHKFME